MSGFSESSGGVKDVQRGTVSFGSGDTSKQIPIDTIDTTKSVIKISYKTMGNNSAAIGTFTGRILDENNIVIERYDGSNSLIFVVSWEVIEFENVKSLQRGQSAFTNNANPSIAIDEINPLKAILFFSARSNSTTTNTVRFGLVRGHIDSPTTIAFDSEAGSSFTYCWEVVEFD